MLLRKPVFSIGQYALSYLDIVEPMTDETYRNQFLSTNERAAIFCAGLAALVIGLSLTFCPGKHIKEERNEFGVVTKSSVETSDQSELAIVLTASSLILFAWGMNGLRLTKLAVGSVSAESKASEVKAAEDYAKQEQTPKEVVVTEKEPDDIAEPLTEGKGSVVINDETEVVYSLPFVPRELLFDLFKHWPSEYSRPKDFSTFEFATKKKGKGNHPWTVKFKDLPAFKISYGGQGKNAATISVPTE